MSEQKFKKLWKQKLERIRGGTNRSLQCCARATWRTTAHRFAILVVNKSYRRHAVGRTTSVVAYVRQTIVNSHPGPGAEQWHQAQNDETRTTTTSAERCGRHSTNPFSPFWCRRLDPTNRPAISSTTSSPTTLCRSVSSLLDAAALL